jgi:UTP--glucose-1-phosphate uridylyltransferase
VPCAPVAMAPLSEWTEKFEQDQGARERERHLHDQMATHTTVKVVIPAAGLGARFFPVTRAVPKELLPIGGKALIHHALIEAERGGFDSALVVISKQKSSIRTYFESDPGLERVLIERGDASAVARLREVADLALRMRLTFIEQPEPLGLGDAVLRCRLEVGSGPFAVLLPDDVVPSAEHWPGLRALHAATGAAALCVRQVAPDDANRFGIANCEVDDAGRMRVRGLVEKPAQGTARSTWAVFGRYIVTEAVLHALARRPTRHAELQLTDGFAAVVDDDPGVFALAFDGETYDAGTPDEYARSVSRYRLT